MENKTATVALQGKRILVAEDDSALMRIVAKILRAEGAEVTETENGRIAAQALQTHNGHFDLVLSDVRMPEMDGVALLKHTKENYPHVRFLIFTGFSEILESQQAFEFGADGFLLKPFKLAELKSAMLEILGGGHNVGPVGAESVLDPDSFCRIRVEEFISTSKLPSDLYVRITQEKFIKIAREGTEIQVSRIQTYREKKVDFFYVQSIDFHKYTGLNLRLSKAVSNSEVLTREQKLKLYKHTTEVLVQQVTISGLQSDLVQETKSLVANTLNVVSENPELLEMLYLIQSRGDDLYAHLWAVSIYSCLIAKKMGWTSMQSQYKLSIAGLYHDLGLKELSPELLAKPRSKMSSEEIRLYESHATRGRDLVLSVPGFPGDLSLIIFQHHETQLGTGYPAGISGLKIHPMAKVVRVADEFCERAFRNGPCENLAEAQKVISEIFDSKAAELDPDALGALYEVFQLERPAPLKKRRSLAA